jgi:hypothetical protein
MKPCWNSSMPSGKFGGTGMVLLPEPATNLQPGNTVAALAVARAPPTNVRRLRPTDTDLCPVVMIFNSLCSLLSESRGATGEKRGQAIPVRVVENALKRDTVKKGGLHQNPPRHCAQFKALVGTIGITTLDG